ncbi:MAG: helix-turn-helix transcriptional regulator [Lutibacter sp.]|nr:helix-turn-helix transcriptional regulator [Lutibacter sp.]
MIEVKKIFYGKKACACAVSLDILGDRWTLIIIRDIFRGKNRFSQFLNESSEGIASNIVVDRLKKLTSNGIINFRRKETDKKIKEYYLTDKGIDLYPIIYELQKWSIKHVEFEFSDNTKKYNELTNKISKVEFIDQILSKYREFRLGEFGI